MASLTAAQIQKIVITERISSVFSLIGAAFVIVTFLLDEKFRKPINRLVFFATIGNVLTNIATLISTNGIEAGTGASLCQFQAFLIQWFMPADALWTLAMACNVWLSFFRSYESAAFRRLEYKYFIVCYGIPFIPALIYLFVNSESRDKIYGSAVLWCWVTIKWDFLRVATFYGPVWIVILSTIIIYIIVGKKILNWRKSVMSMERPHSDTMEELSSTNIIKTSEVTITRGEETRQANRPSSSLAKSSSFSNSGHTTRQITTSRVFRPKGATNPNEAALKYCKCAMLFFAALIITWVPSTINRIYNIVRPDEVVFGLNLAAALVLPLQGFWNAIIYIATSTFAVKCLWKDIVDLCCFKRPHQESISMVVRRDSRMNRDQGNGSSSGSVRSDLRPASSQRDLVEPAK